MHLHFDQRMNFAQGGHGIRWISPKQCLFQAHPHITWLADAGGIGLRMRKSRVNPSRQERSGGMATPRRLIRERAEAAVATLVAVRPHEIPPLMSAATTFFFVSQPLIRPVPARLRYAI